MSGAQADPALRARALRLHREALVVDGHNDLPWRLREGPGLDLSRSRLDERSDRGHTDLVRLREGGVDAQWWAAWVPPEVPGPAAAVMALEQVDLIRRMAERWPDRLEMAYSADDVERVAASGRTACLVGLEGGHVIAGSIPVLRQLYRAGGRYLTLTHGVSHEWADAAGDRPRHGGLTEFGREVVREMNRLGMVVDLSHVSDDVMRDALAVSRAPVAFTHSGARAVADHARNVPDDVLRATAAAGGVVMVNFYSGFVVPESAAVVRDFFAVRRRLRERHAEDEAFERAWNRWLAEHPVERGTVSDVVDHLDHIARVAGIDHVGLGSDFDGVSDVPEGLEDVSAFPAITEELLRRGYAEGDVRKVLGGNFLRVYRAVEAAAAELSAREAPRTARLRGV